MSKHGVTTEPQVRSAFWAAHPEHHRIRGYRQNDYPADVRLAFVDYVDHLAREGAISDALAQRVTL